jgi:hypothetical protein
LKIKKGFHRILISAYLSYPVQVQHEKKMMLQYKLTRPSSTRSKGLNGNRFGQPKPKPKPKRVSLSPCGGDVAAEEHEPRIPSSRRALSFHKPKIDDFFTIPQDYHITPGMTMRRAEARRISPATVVISSPDDDEEDQILLAPAGGERTADEALYSTPPTTICEYQHDYYKNQATEIALQKEESPPARSPFLLKDSDANSRLLFFALSIEDAEQAAVYALVRMMQYSGEDLNTENRQEVVSVAAAGDTTGIVVSSSEDNKKKHKKKKRKYHKRNAAWWEEKSKNSKKPRKQEVEPSFLENDDKPIKSPLLASATVSLSSASASGGSDTQFRKSRRLEQASDEEEVLLPPQPSNIVEGMRLATPQDHEELNSLHCFVRAELLEACTLQLQTISLSPTSTVRLSPPRRVGFRCVFCGHKPRNERTGSSMSAFFPKSLQDIYRGVCTWQRLHFKSCLHTPDEVKKTYCSLKDTDRTRGRKSHWVKTAYQLGLRDADSQRGGIVWNPKDDSGEVDFI